MITYTHIKLISLITITLILSDYVAVSAQGDSCANPLQLTFCPAQDLFFNDSTLTNSVEDWGSLGISNTPGKDAFIQINLPNDTAFYRKLRCKVEVPYISSSAKLYLFWFRGPCGSTPEFVDSFYISSLPYCSDGICFARVITDTSITQYTLGIDFSDTVKFDMHVELGYNALYTDTECYDTAVIDKGIIELDSSMCSTNLNLFLDTSMIYLPANMPPSITLRDASPNNNGYLVTVKKVSANLGMYNHPFENKVPFAIDSANQDYCDIIITFFLKNLTGREAINGIQLQLDNNFDVITPLSNFGPYIYPDSAAFYNPNGAWNGVYDPSGHTITWEFVSTDGRGDIDTYGPYSCKAYHIGFRSRVSLSGNPFNLNITLQGDSWGDSTLTNVCGPKSTNCSFKCPCTCLSRPGEENFIALNTSGLSFNIEGFDCENNITHQNETYACSAGPPLCIEVDTTTSALIYEGLSGLYKIATPVSGMVCPDSCMGRVVSADSLGCERDIHFLKSGYISSLSQYNGADFYLCPGDTLILFENDTMSGCENPCVSCHSHLIDSSGNVVEFDSGRYYITIPGVFYDYGNNSMFPCVSFVVYATQINASALITQADCDETCHMVIAQTDTGNINYSWFDASGNLIGSGNTLQYCHSDSLHVYLRAQVSSSCFVDTSVFLAVDSITIPQIRLDTIVPIPCGIGSGVINIHNMSDVTYEWTDGSFIEDLVTSVPGQYGITATNSFGCSDSAEFSIFEVAPFSVSVAGDDTVCLGDYVQLCALPLGSFEWSTGDQSSCISALVDGSLLSVTVTDNAGCSAIGHYFPGLVDSVTLSYEIEHVPCETFYSSGMISVTPLTGVSGFQYQWSNAETDSINSNLTPGNYNLTVTDFLGCTVTANISVDYLDLFHINAIPELDTLILGQSRQLEVTTTGSSATRFVWSPGSYIDCSQCTNPLATPSVDMLYVVQGADVNGCTDIDTVRLVVIPDYSLFVPNVFTPNNDGNNDVWEVFGNIDAVQKFNLKIFDRWGEKVFETRDKNFQWNGIYKGEPLMPGVYVYQIYVTWLDGSYDGNYKGSITLLK